MPDPTPEPQGSSGVSQADASEAHAAEATRGGRRPTKEELDARNAAKSRPAPGDGPSPRGGGAGGDARRRQQSDGAAHRARGLKGVASDDLSLFSNLALDDAATSASTGTVCEPTAASSGADLLVTGNWFASRSSDAGQSWQFVDPETMFPASMGGFCCDQVALYEPSRDLWIWLLQYRTDATGTNLFHVRGHRHRRVPVGQLDMVGLLAGVLRLHLDRRLVRLPGCRRERRASLADVQPVRHRRRLAACARLPVRPQRDGGREPAGAAVVGHHREWLPPLVTGRRRDDVLDEPAEQRRAPGVPVGGQRQRRELVGRAGHRLERHGPERLQRTVARRHQLA